jgi:hypothetical protein
MISGTKLDEITGSVRELTKSEAKVVFERHRDPARRENVPVLMRFFSDDLEFQTFLRIREQGVEYTPNRHIEQLLRTKNEDCYVEASKFAPDSPLVLLGFSGLDRCAPIERRRLREVAVRKLPDDEDVCINVLKVLIAESEKELSEIALSRLSSIAPKHDQIPILRAKITALRDDEPLDATDPANLKSPEPQPQGNFGGFF